MGSPVTKQLHPSGAQATTWFVVVTNRSHRAAVPLGIYAGVLTGYPEPMAGSFGPQVDASEGSVALSQAILPCPQNTRSRSSKETSKHLARTVHDLYFEPKYGVPTGARLESLQPFTWAFKELDPISQLKATIYVL